MPMPNRSIRCWNPRPQISLDRPNYFGIQFLQECGRSKSWQNGSFFWNPVPCCCLLVSVRELPCCPTEKARMMSTWRFRLGVRETTCANHSATPMCQDKHLHRKQIEMMQLKDETEPSSSYYYAIAAYDHIKYSKVFITLYVLQTEILQHVGMLGKVNMGTTCWPVCNSVRNLTNFAGSKNWINIRVCDPWMLLPFETKKENDDLARLVQNVLQLRITYEKPCAHSTQILQTFLFDDEKSKIVFQPLHPHGVCGRYVINKDYSLLHF